MASANARAGDLHPDRQTLRRESRRQAQRAGAEIVGAPRPRRERRRGLVDLEERRGGDRQGRRQERIAVAHPFGKLRADTLPRAQQSGVFVGADGFAAQHAFPDPRIDVEVRVLDVGAMKRVSLGRDDPAVLHHYLVEIERKARFLHPRAELAQRRDGFPVGANHVGQRGRGEGVRRKGGDAHVAHVGQVFQHDVEIAAGRRQRRRIARIGAGHRREQQPAVLDGAAERADRVERAGQRHGAVEADAAVGGLQSGDAAQRRRNADRSTRVRADRRRTEPAGDRDGGSARRATCDAMRLRIPGIPRRAHRPVASPAAEREFDHVRLAERDHAGGREAQNRGCRVIGDATPPALGTGGGLVALRRAAGP